LQAWRKTGVPYAYHTLGSAMAIRGSAYASIGGMPRKQAGEDFYFLQKLIPLGNFGEINKTKVIPSPRPSDRVIFGTGAAITNYINGSGDISLTYNLNAFSDLNFFFSYRSQLFDLNLSEFESWSQKLPKPLRVFLLNTNFSEDLQSLKNNCSCYEIFNKRFFEIFNAFKIVKYLNFVHNGFFEKMNVMNASLNFLRNNNYSVTGLNNEKQVLMFFRSLEK
jgi:hypothetical protein